MNRIEPDLDERQREHDMADQKRTRNRKTDKSDQQSDRPDQADRRSDTLRTPGERGPGGTIDPIHNPPPPEATNAAHPGRVGERTGVPGEGIIHAGGATEAGSQTRADDASSETSSNAPNRPPQAAPGAARPSTTASGPASPPTSGGAGAGGRSRDDTPQATETYTGGGAALSTPHSQAAGPRGVHGGAGNPEIHDPNYTAKTAHQYAPPDAGVTRMDRGEGHETRDFRPRNLSGGAPRTAQDVMTADVSVCAPDTTLYYVARMMLERNCGGIPVVDSTETMKPVGIVTDRDMVIRLVAKNQDPLAHRAQDCMSSDVVTARPDESIEACSDRMEQRQIRRLIVVDETGRVCGIVAQADIARAAPLTETGDLVRDVSQPRRPGAAGDLH